MPARRTDKIEEVKRRLLSRLANGFYRPGDRFLSNRAVADTFGISYQTAHLLIGELCAEGHLERRPQSGTYVPGALGALTGVELVFHPRANAEWSFGKKLLSRLIRRLDAERLSWSLSAWGPGAEQLPADRLPVIWEVPAAVAHCAERGMSAVLINDRPKAGMESLFIDSVSTDDFSGGACAAEMLRRRLKRSEGYVVVTGPDEDPRSRLRTQGFLSVLSATTVSAGSWFFDGGYQAAEAAVKQAKTGIFCCNDQLASAVVAWCEEHAVESPPLIGFDDAPVAERLNLTSISIPWDELVDGVANVVKRRLTGDRSATSHQMFSPRPVIRG